MTTANIMWKLVFAKYFSIHNNVCKQYPKDKKKKINKHIYDSFCYVVELFKNSIVSLLK